MMEDVCEEKYYSVATLQHIITATPPQNNFATLLLFCVVSLRCYNTFPIFCCLFATFFLISFAVSKLIPIFALATTDIHKSTTL